MSSTVRVQKPYPFLHLLYTFPIFSRGSSYFSVTWRDKDNNGDTLVRIIGAVQLQGPVNTTHSTQYHYWWLWSLWWTTTSCQAQTGNNSFSGDTRWHRMLGWTACHFKRPKQSEEDKPSNELTASSSPARVGVRSIRASNTSSASFRT